MCHNKSLLAGDREPRHVSDKTVEEMQQVLVNVPAFNPLRNEEAVKLKLLQIPTVMQRVKDVADDAAEQILEQLGENEVGDETGRKFGAIIPKFLQDRSRRRSSCSIMW